MAKKGTKVSKKEELRMWELYQQLGSYTAVAKKMRRHADTVSRHVQIYEAALAVANILR